MWLNETMIENWRNSPYPTSINEQPIFSYNNSIIFDEKRINGLYYTTLFLTVF